MIPNNQQVSTASRASGPYSSLQIPFQQDVPSGQTESGHSRARSSSRRRESTRLDSSPRLTESHYPRARSPSRTHGSTRLDSSIRHALSPPKGAGSPFRRLNHPPWPTPLRPPNSPQGGRIVRRIRSFETFLSSESGEDEYDDGFNERRVRETGIREVGDIGRELKRQRDEVFGRIRR